LRKELILAGTLVGVGLLVLPPTVYWVGRQVVGEYESAAGLIGLMDQIWSEFFTGQPAAWLLVMSPYLVVQLLRLAVHAKRYRVDVTDVTNSEHGT
jgi:hypothetical protein